MMSNHPQVPYTDMHGHPSPPFGGGIYLGTGFKIKIFKLLHARLQHDRRIITVCLYANRNRKRGSELKSQTQGGLKGSYCKFCDIDGKIGRAHV